MLAPPPPDETASYLATLRQRLAKLEGDANRLFEGEHLREEAITRTHAELLRGRIEFRQEMAMLDERLVLLKRLVIKLVDSVRNSARRPQFGRLQQRVDAWRGEEFINREEFKRVLREAIRDAQR